MYSRLQSLQLHEVKGKMAEKMVDRVKKLSSQPEKIRNIAICAHIDHGKTTFSDNLLAGAGMMSENLAGDARALDFHADEAERGITIDSASVSMVHKFDNDEYLINLIDTPGHVDFGGDVTRAMRAVDGAIVLCCASEGIMPQTETVLRQALKERVQPVLFINKVDRLIKELKLTPEQMQERFIKIITNVNKLIKQIAETDFGDRWQCNVQEGQVAFGSAYHNWGLSIPYMQRKGITFKDIITAYQNDNQDEIDALAKKAPIHEVVLNMVIRHLPNPKQAQPYRIPKLWHGDPESVDGKSLVNCDSKGPLFYVPIKIVVDPQAGEIVYGRCFSGTVKKGTEVVMNRAKQRGRMQQIFIANGAKREIIDEVPCGNIVLVGGLKTLVGETVTTKESDVFDEISHLFEPVISKAIKAKSPADLSRLVEILRIIQKEDPSIKIQIDEETGQNLMHGMGELHLEIIENRIKTEKGLEVETSPPIVIYRESITKKSEEFEGKSPNKHNKFYFTVEPVEEAVVKAIKDGKIHDMRVKGKDLELRKVLVDECGYDNKDADRIKQIYNGNILMDMTRGQVHMGEVIEMIMDTFEDVMNNGPLAREPCFGCKVMLHDMKLHEDAIHRGPAQVYPAIREGVRGAMMSGAVPVMFEPVQILQIEAPSDFMGEISKLVTSKRGQLLDVEQDDATTHMKVKMPVMELIGWSNDLRSSTSGRGVSSLVDQMFERLPGELQGKVVQQIIQRKGLAETQVGI
ncbi:elongation factor EF-2 [Candidatus Woesearchaeota archaeon]|nr:elongation factor EF-2 [Candidatus Woesearchaeota archaeon]